MKNKIFLTLAASTLLFFVSCETGFDTDVQDVQVTSGSANFSKYVALGNSLTSGYRDGALYVDGQNESYPSMIAKQMMLAGGGAFKQPLMSDNLGGIPAIGVSNKLILTVNATGGLSPIPALGTATNTINSIFTAGNYFQNMGVPGAKSFHLLAPGYGSAAGIAAGTANPYFVRFASSTTTTVLADAMAQNPTFFSLWIGNNDVLGYATSGGDGSNPITPTATFTQAYTALITTLTGAPNNAKGVVANIPNITSIPLFTTVPFNPITPDKFNSAATGASNQDANIDQLNAQVFGPLVQISTAAGQGGRFQLLSKTTANPLLILDESLTNISTQITSALIGVGVSPQQAGLMGAIYGQARHANATDLVPLTTSSVIGTLPSSPMAVSPFNKYGITYPLEDKHVLRGTFGTNSGEVGEVLAATTAFNATIKSLATSKGLAFVDANAKMASLSSQSGIQFDGVKYTAKFVTGGTFSLDGVHLTGRGYGVIANEFIKAINYTYGSTLPQVNPNTYSGVTFP